MEDKLVRELAAARTAWKEAGARLRSVLRKATGETNTAESSLALHRASTAYRLSLENYRECLRRYSEIIKAGKGRGESRRRGA